MKTRAVIDSNSDTEFVSWNWDAASNRGQNLELAL